MSRASAPPSASISSLIERWVKTHELAREDRDRCRDATSAARPSTRARSVELASDPVAWAADPMRRSSIGWTGAIVGPFRASCPSAAMRASSGLALPSKWISAGAFTDRSTQVVAMRQDNQRGLTVERAGRRRSRPCQQLTRPGRSSAVASLRQHANRSTDSYRLWPDNRAVALAWPRARSDLSPRKSTAERGYALGVSCVDVRLD